MANQNQNQGNSNRGFASMDEDKQREIAAKGGRAAHESGNAHEFSSEEAREAGRKGGEAVSQDRQHMADIGREGGQNSRGGGNQGGNQGGGQQQQERGGGNNRGGMTANVASSGSPRFLIRSPRNVVHARVRPQARPPRSSTCQGDAAGPRLNSTQPLRRPHCTYDPRR